MEQSLPGGVMGGELVQYSSTDGFGEVEQFYQEALGQYNPEAMSHTSELGRQTALTIKKKYGLLTVAIQELTDENKVTITFMAAGM